MSAFNECAFNECAFESQLFHGEWVGTYPFTYEAGATVYVTPIFNSSVPLGTSLDIYASEDEITFTKLTKGVSNYVTFTSTVSGTTNLYIKIVMDSSSSGVTPIVYSLSLLIHQETSLYTIATQVMDNALSSVNSTWYIDTELQKYPIKYAWLERMSHRKALAKIAEASGGVAYQGRTGVVRLEAGNYIQKKKYSTPDIIINEDRVYDSSSPASSVGNLVQVKTHPYKALTTQKVWELSGDDKIPANGIRTYQASYDFDAVINANVTITSTPSGATITKSDFYFSGATIVVESPVEATITLVINGQPLQETGSRVITERDGESIRRYGEKTIAINENNLIQTVEIAELIAESIVDITANASRDAAIDWRGDPTIELGDIASLSDQKGVVVSQEINFDGTLSASAKIRRF